MNAITHVSMAATFRAVSSSSLAARAESTVPAATAIASRRFSSCSVAVRQLATLPDRFASRSCAARPPSSACPHHRVA